MAESSEAGERSQAAAVDGSGPSAAAAAGLCVLGAVLVGLSPLFVRLADVGPAASAFWRAALALPVLALWAAAERRPVDAPAPNGLWIAAAGLFFAGDLAFWHLSILNTTLANATFLTNCAPPVIVALGAWAVLGDRPSRRVVLGLALALAGAALLTGESVRLDPANLRGDAYALITAAFFSAYLVALKAAGPIARPGQAAFQATAATTAALGVVYAFSGEATLWPATLSGWAAVIALGVLCQGAGQGAIIAAIRGLPAGFAAMILLLEPITTVLAGWVWLGEAMGPGEALGGALTLAALLVARPRAPRRNG